MSLICKTVIKNRVIGARRSLCTSSIFRSSDKSTKDDKGKDCKDGGKDGSPDDPCSSMYDCRKYSPCLPCSLPNMAAEFEMLAGIPNGVFRYTAREVLGPCASKCWYYKNPEYFSFHDMSFFDINLYLSNCRQPQTKTGRKP